MNPSDNAPHPANSSSLLRSLRGPVMLVTLGTLFMIDHSGGAASSNLAGVVDRAGRDVAGRASGQRKNA